MNVPKLRFKDDDGREFPGWEEKELGALCATFKSGNGITSKHITENGKYPVYGGNGLRGYTNTFTHNGFFVLIGRQGALCGNINRSHGKVFISEHAIAVNTNETSDTAWLAYKLDCMKLNRLSESSAQPGLSVNKLVKLKLIVPSKPEQTKIANFLTAIDEKITQLTQKHDCLKQYKKGVMQQIFSQKLRFKDDDGREFSEWEEKKLGDSATLYNGRAYKQSEWENTGIPVIRLQNLTGSGENYYYSNIKLPENQYCNKGDLLFMWSATFGPVWWNGGKAIYHYHIWKIETNSKQLLKNYLYYVLDDITAKMKNTSNGSTMLHVTKGGMEKLKIKLPAVTEQTKIANFLTAIDDKITQTQTQLEAVKHYKKGLLQQMFV